MGEVCIFGRARAISRLQEHLLTCRFAGSLPGKLKQDTLGRLAHDCTYMQAPREIQTTLQGLAHKGDLGRAGKYDRKCSIDGKQARHRIQQTVRRKNRRVTCPHAPFGGWHDIIDKEGRIGQDVVKRTVGGGKHPHISLMNGDARSKRAGLGIAPGLLYRRGINVNALHSGMRRTLCSHQGYQSTAGADVKYMARVTHACPCSQQDSIGAHWHRGLVMTHLELAKSEVRLAHSLHSFCKTTDMLPAIHLPSRPYAQERQFGQTAFCKNKDTHFTHEEPRKSDYF